MSEIILGIDLGTTQSCVAIPARPGRGIDEPVELIPDYLGRETTPSVVTEDSDGNIIVGYVAKQSAGCSPKPIFFIKRYMGTDYTERLRGQDCRPEDISAETLKYLRQMAADFLGVPLTEVKKAVICVPAYFDLPQSQATIKAGELAGLEVVSVLKEPIAAALAYGYNHADDNLKIFCYDLGGGTFDATVLEKQGVDYNVRAFGGDPCLGGCDFDKVLANFILGKLKEKGYKLDLDFSRGEDDSLYQRFLLAAEKYKHSLSKDLEVRVREVDFADQAGTTMRVDMLIRRSEFEDLIRGEVDEELEELYQDYRAKGVEQAMTNYLVREGFRPEQITPPRLEQRLGELEREIQRKTASIKKTRYLTIVSLMKSGLFPQEMDKIIMVGGSSHIPLVAGELLDIFGKNPELVDPDAIVAKGAALKAAMLRTDAGQGVPGLKVVEVPPETFLEQITIRGTVDFKELQAKPGRVRVRLSRAPDYEQEAVPDAQGNFEFQDVELLPECENHLEVTAFAGKKTLATYGFAVLQNSEAEVKDTRKVSVDTDFLTKPIDIETVDGLERIFVAGTKIPNKKDVPKKTTDQSGMVRIPVYEGYQLLTEIRVENVSTSLLIGTPVEITIEVTRDLDLIGRARVPADNNKEGEVKIKIENLPLPSEEEMKKSFEELRDAFDAALEVVQDRDAKLRYKKKGRNLLRDLERELLHHPPIRPKIASMLLDLEHLIKKMNAAKVLQPSLDAFQKKVKTAYELDKEEGKYAKNIPALQEEGEKAYEKKDEPQWKLVNKGLDDIIADLDKEDNGSPPPPEILAPLWQMQMIEKVRELSLMAQELGVETQYAGRLQELKKKVEAVDVRTDPAEACRKLLGLFKHDYQELHYDITGKKATGLPSGRVK